MENDQSVSSYIEELAPGVTFERLHDGRVYVFTLPDVSRVSIDAWTSKVKELVQIQPDDRPFMALTIVQGKYGNLTPYVRGRMQELSRWNPDMWCYVGVVLPKTFFVQLMSAFLPTLQLRNSQTRVFYAREDGLAWLEKALGKLEKES